MQHLQYRTYVNVVLAVHNLYVYIEISVLMCYDYFLKHA